MAQPDYRLLDTELPYRVGNAALQGMQDVNALRAQTLQNQAKEFDIQNALAEQEAYKQAAQGGVGVSQALMERGLGRKAAEYQKTTAEAQKLGLEGQLKQAELHRDRLNVLAGNPDDTSLIKYYQNGVASGEFTPEQAQQSWAQMQGKTPEQRRQILLPQAMTMVQHTKYLHDQAQLAISQQNTNIAGGHLALAQKREDRIASGITAATLTPRQNEALFGENGAATRGLINPNKLNARTAKMWADAFILNPNANPTAVSQDIKAAEKSINSFAAGEDGKTVQRLNTASDHLETLQEMIPTLQNNDVRAFNAMANKIAEQTGQPAPTNFQQAARIVGSEVAKAIIPGQGASKEREEFVKPFSTAASPAQLQGAINTSLKLLGGQYKSLENKYRTATKRTDFADTQLTPGAKNAYQSATAGGKSAAPAAARPAGVGADWQLMTDASGNKAWVSPDKKSFKEVK